MIILVDNGHGINTKGKRSPDGRLMEYAYARDVAKEIVNRLTRLGYDARRIVTEETDVPLQKRVLRVNQVCQIAGSRNVLMVSVHCNAAPPDDGKWHNARGWEAYTSPGRTAGDRLADCLYASARNNLPNIFHIRMDMTDGDADKEARFYMLTQTWCAAVLTENLFQDNRHDVDYLLSEDGFNAIVQLHVDGIVDYIKTQKP